MDKLILKYWYITPAFPLAGLIQIIDILFIIIQFRFKHLVTKLYHQYFIMKVKYLPLIDILIKN